MIMATLAELQARKALYEAAEVKVLARQEYWVGQGTTARRLRYADLAEIRAEIERLDAEIERKTAEAAGTRRVLYIR